MQLNRVSPLYPGLFITIRYQLDPKTGLFLNDEDRIKCYISPTGWDSTGGFNVPTRDLEKEILPGRKAFHFKAFVQVELGDAKASAKAFDSGVEFTAPRKHGRIGVEGELDYKGKGLEGRIGYHSFSILQPHSAVPLIIHSYFSKKLP